MGDKQVLFYEQDIRGLLAKQWANQSRLSRSSGSERFFIGDRCHLGDDEIAVDAINNRPLDGKVCSSFGGVAGCKASKSAPWYRTSHIFSAKTMEADKNAVFFYAN